MKRILYVALFLIVAAGPLMASDYNEPLNLGQDRMISINELVDIVAGIAGVSVDKRHIEGPMGVRGRNSDNTLMRDTLGWEPEISLEEGLARTYTWIEAQVAEQIEVEEQELVQKAW